MSRGFIKLNREAEILLETDPNAFLLMCQIAFRAKWKDNKLDMSKTKLGEALVGDYENCGLTEKAYRLAKLRLEDRKIAAFKGTNKGTIAKVLDNCFCDLNLEDLVEQKGEQKDIPRADKGRTKGEPGATKEEVKKERREEDIFINAPGAVEFGAPTRRFFALDEKTKTFLGLTKRDIEGWQKTYEYLNPLDYLDEMATWLLENRPLEYRQNIPRKFFTNWLSKNNLINQTNLKKGQKNDRSNATQRQGNQMQGRFINGKRDNSPLIAGGTLYD